MSGSVKLGLYLLAAVIAIFVALKIVGMVLGLLVPILILGAIGYVVYSLVNRKALGGNRRTLP